jgi:hypothetical protein
MLMAVLKLALPLMGSAGHVQGDNKHIKLSACMAKANIQGVRAYSRVAWL